MSAAPAALTAAAAIVLAAATSAPAQDQCPLPRPDKDGNGVTIVLETPKVRISQLRQDNSGIARQIVVTSTGCLKESGRTRELHSGGEYGSGSFDLAGGFAAAGTEVAFVREHGDSKRADHEVIRVDLADGATWRRDEGANAVPDVDVNRRGDVAWVSVTTERARLFLRRGARTRRCASSRAKIGALALGTRALRWRAGDRARSTRLADC